jgi:hypothetical protein
MRTGYYGRWIGQYPETEQTVDIEQHGAQLLAVKVTGNDYMPAGVATFAVDLDTMDAIGFTGNRETGEMQSVPGRITVIDRDRFRFQWRGHGGVIFRREGI